MPTIREAAQALAARCDGAVEEDGAGFNKPDQWVKDLLMFPRWTHQQEMEVRDALLKYKGQLKAMGIEVFSLQVELHPAEVEAEGVIEHDGVQFILRFPYREEVKDALKQTVLGRCWDPDRKCRSAPNTSYETVELFATTQGFQVTLAAQKVIDTFHGGAEKRSLTDPLNPTEVAQMENFLDGFRLTPKPTSAPKAPAKNITLERGMFVIRFPYDDYIREDLKQTVPGRQWSPPGFDKVWVAPLVSEMQVREFAARHSFVLGKSMAKATEVREASRMKSRAVDSPFMADFRSKSGFALRPYQRAGAEYLVTKERCILGDSMRLGKTVQVMAATEHVRGKDATAKVLVICPSAIIPVWQEHCREWLPTLRVRTAPASPDGADIFITSYDRAQRNRARLIAAGFKVVVCDESHRLKNREAKRTQAILGHGDRRDGSFIPGIVDKAVYRWFLTGTAVERRPSELLQPLIGLGRLEDLGGFAGFASRYCGWVKGVPGSIHGCNYAALPELNERLAATCFLRRTMEDVYTDLPERTYVHVPLEMRNSRRYFAEQAKALEALDETEYNSAVGDATLMTLRRIAAEEKVESAIEWVTEFLEDSEDRKLVLLGWHREPLQAIHRHFASQAVLFIGGQTDREKVKRFQEDPGTRLFVGSILAAGEGIQLSAASDVAVFELPWNASTLDQGIARILNPGVTTRMGIHYLLATGSVDEEIAVMVDQKRKVATGIHDGKVVEDGDAAMVGRLLKAVKDKTVVEVF